MADEPPSDSHQGLVDDIAYSAAWHREHCGDFYCNCRDEDVGDGSDRIVRIELRDDDDNVIGVWDRNNERG